jgi:hypothetical protein
MTGVGDGPPVGPDPGVAGDDAAEQADGDPFQVGADIDDAPNRGRAGGVVAGAGPDVITLPSRMRDRVCKVTTSTAPRSLASRASDLRCLRAAYGIGLVQRQARLAVPPWPHLRLGDPSRAAEECLYP